MNAIVGGAGLGLFNTGMQDQGLGGASFGQGGNRYYVNGTTGNLVIQRQDQVVKSHGLDTSLIRTYNSQDTEQQHWYFRISQNLTINSSQDVIRTSADGFKQKFTPNSAIDSTAGVLSSTEGVGAHDSLYWDASLTVADATGAQTTGVWVYTEGSSRVTEYYDGAGVLIARRDAQGYQASYSYDTAGDIQYIVNASGEITEFEKGVSSVSGLDQFRVSTYRGSVGAPSQSTEYSVVTYEYNTDGLLSKVIVDLTPYDASIDDGQVFVTSYSYTGSQLDGIEEWQGSESRPQDETQIASMVFTYDDDNRVTHIIVGKGEQAEVTGYVYSTNIQGNATVEARRYLQYSYSNEGGVETYTPIKRATTTYTFDDTSRLIKMQDPASESGVRHTTHYVYDDFDNVTQIRDNENRVVRRQFSVLDSDGEVLGNQGTLLWEQDGEGNYVRYEYNSDNLLIAEKRYVHADIDTTDQVLPGASDDAEQVTRYYYDNEKRLRFVVDATGRVTETRYRQTGTTENPNDNDHLGGVTTAGSGWVALTYQYLDQLDSNALSGLDASSDIAAEIGNFSNGAQVTQTDFDFRGQVKSVYQLDADDAVLSKQHFVYDGAGRLIKTIEGRGTLDDGENGEDRATLRTVSYNLDADNFETLYVYDGLGRLLATAVSHVEGVGGNLNAVVENGLDVDANLSGSDFFSAIDQNSSQRTFNSVSHYQFNDHGGWTITSLATDHDGDGNVLQNEQVFDSAGRLLSSTQSVWDASSQVTLDTDNYTIDTTRYYYDDGGRLIMTTDPEGVRTHRFYNNRGEMIGQIDGSGALVEYQYNGAGQLERTLAYANYLGVAQLSRLVSLGSDAEGNPEYLPTRVELADIRPEFSADDRIARNLYDDAGRLAYTIDGEGYVIEYQYDGKGQLINTIEHSTPYEGYDYVAEEGLAISTGQNEELAAFARLSYENGTYNVVQKAWTQEPYQTTGEANVTLTQAVTATSDSETPDYHDYSYRIVDGTDINEYDLTYSVKDLSGTLGRASWASDFNRTTLEGEPIDTTRPENYGFVAFNGNQFGALGTVATDQPYFSVEEGALKLWPANVFYEGDTNFWGTGNLRDQMIFAGTRQYDRNHEDGIQFEYEFSQDNIVDNQQHVLFGIGDENGHQIGIRLSEEFTSTDTNAHDGFYNSNHFTREPGETYKITAEVTSVGVQFRFFHKLAEPDAEGNPYEELHSAWSTQSLFSEDWGDAIHSVIEIAGDVDPNDSTNSEVIQIHNIAEQGMLLEAPFRDVPEGLGYSATTITQGDGVWSLGSDIGDVIGEVADEQPFFNQVDGDLVITARNVAGESGNVHRLIGDNTFSHHPSLPVSYKYYFSGGEPSAYSRFFLGVKDLGGEGAESKQYGVLFTNNDLIRSTGISGNNYSTIDAQRNLSPENTGYLEYELVAGKLHIYYAPTVQFDAQGNDISSHLDKVLVYEEYVGSSWGEEVESVIEVRDHNGSRADTLTVRRIVEIGTSDWKAKRYQDPNAGTYSPGITAENVFDVVNPLADNYLDPSVIRSMDVRLYEVDSAGNLGGIVGSQANLIHPTTYDGEVELYSGDPVGLSEGRYRALIDYDYWIVDQEGNATSATGSKTLDYIHERYQVREQTPQGAMLENVFTDSSTTLLSDINENYVELITTVRNKETGFEAKGITELSDTELYTGYLNLVNEGALADGRYTYSVDGVSAAGEVEELIINSDLVIGPQYEYSQTIGVDLSGINGVDASSVQFHYWKTDGGSGGEISESMSATATAGHYSINLSDLQQGNYSYRVDFLQQDGANEYFSDYGSVEGSFNVAGAADRTESIERAVTYWTADVKETGLGVTIEAYLDTENGLIATTDDELIDVSTITQLTATVRDVVSGAVISVVSTDRTVSPAGTELDLMISNGDVLPAGQYIVDVVATVNTTEYALVGITEEDPITITSGLPESNVANNTRLEWDNQPGKNTTITFGATEQALNNQRYYAVEITNNDSGVPSAVLSYQSRPYNTFNGMTLGPVVQQGILPGADYGDDNLNLQQITTAVDAYYSNANYVNAGLSHDIQTWYQTRQVAVDSSRSGDTLTLQWDAHTDTQTFDGSAEGFDLNPDGASAAYDRVHAFREDGQLLLRSTGDAAQSETETDNGWYRVLGERHYTNSAPAQFSVDFNVGRASYDGFIGLTNGVAGGKLGIRIDGNRNLYLLNGDDLGADLTGQTPLLTQVPANQNYQLEVSLEGAAATLRLLNADGSELTSPISQTLTLTEADWADYFLLFASAGQGARIGNPLIIDTVRETGLQTQQSNSLQYRAEDQANWNNLAAITLVEQNGVYRYQASLDLAGVSAEAQTLEVQIAETRNSANLRKASFNLELGADNAAAQQNFSVMQDQSARQTGTAIEHFFNYDQPWQYAVTTITNSNNEIVDTVTTWADGNDSQALILNQNRVLDNDTYRLSVALFNGGTNPTSTQNYTYTISDQTGTADQSLAWTIDTSDLDGLDPNTQVTFNYRVQGSTQSYLAKAVEYNADTGTFNTTLTGLQQGETVDFLINTLDANGNISKTYNGRIVAGEGNATVIRDVFAVSDLLSHGTNTINITLDSASESSAVINAYGRTQGANDLVLSQDIWLDDGEYQADSNIGNLPDLSIQIGGRDIALPPGEALPQLRVVDAFDHYLVEIEPLPQNTTAPADFRPFTLELAKDLSKSTFDVDDLNEGRYAFGVEYANGKEVSTLQQNTITVGAQANVSVDVLDRFFAYTTQSSLVKQLSMDTRVDDSDRVLMEYGSEYVRITNENPVTTNVGIVDNRSTQDIQIDWDGDSPMYYVDLPESSLGNSDIGENEGEHYLYFVTNDYQNMLSQVQELGSIENRVYQEDRRRSLGGPREYYTIADAMVDGERKTYQSPFEMFSIIGWTYGRNYFMVDENSGPLPTLTATDNFTNVDTNGYLSLDPVLSLNYGNSGYTIGYQFQVNNVDRYANLNDELSFDESFEFSDGENLTLYRLGVDANFTSIMTTPDSIFDPNGYFLNHREWNHEYDPSSLVSLGELAIGNDIVLNLENALINGKYKPFIQYHDQVDTGAGWFPGSSAWEAWEAEQQERADQGLPRINRPLRAEAPVMASGVYDGNSIILDSYDANQGDQIQLEIKLFDITRDDIDFENADADNYITKVGADKISDLFIRRAFDINEPVNGLESISLEFDEETHTTTLNENASGLGIQLTLDQEEITQAIQQNGDAKRVAVEFFDPAASSVDALFGVGPEYLDIDRSYYWRTSDYVTYVSDLSDEDGASWEQNRTVNLLTESEHLRQMAYNPQYFITQDDIDADPDLTASDLGKLRDGVYNFRVHILHDNNTVTTTDIDYGQVGTEEEIRVPVLDLELDVSDDAELYIQYTDGTDSWTSQATTDGQLHQFRLESLYRTEADIASLLEDENYTPTSYSFNIIVQDADSGKEYVTSRQGSFEVDFSSNAPEIINVTFSRDIDGRETRSFYDVNGLLQAVLHADGAFEEYVYDGASRMIQAIYYGTRLSPEQLNANLSWSEIRAVQQEDPSRYRFTLYDAAGRVSAEVDENRYVTTYHYVSNSSHVADTTRHVAPLKQTVTDEWLSGVRLLVGDSLADEDFASDYAGANQRTAFNYNQQGALLSSIKQTGSGSVYTDQRITLNSYDALGRVVGTEHSAGATIDDDDSRTRSSSVVHDAKGRVLSEVIAGQQWIYDYDQNGLRTQATLMSDEQGQEERTTRYFYDANGRLAFTLDAANQLNEIKYNAFGDVVGNVEYARYLTEQYLGVDPSELAGGLLSANLLAKFRNLDKSSAGVQHANHSETFNLYNRRGELSIALDAEGNRRDYQYNAFGDTLREIRYARGGNLDGQKIVNQNIYDKRGRLLVSSQDAFGLSQTNSMKYDAFGRVVESVDANGDVRISRYQDPTNNSSDGVGRTIEVFLQGQSEGAEKRLITTEYDAFGRTVRTVNANAQATTFYYNDQNRTLSVITPEGVVTTTTFNVHGDTISVDTGEGYTLESRYDVNGRLEQTFKYQNDGVNDTRYELVEQGYYTSGLLKSTTDANDNRVEYTYDAAQRMLVRTVAPDDVNLSLKTEYRYDSLANGKEIIERVSPKGDDSYIETVSRFDNNGRLSQQILRGGDDQETVTHFQYDDLGQQIQVSKAATHRPEWVRDFESGDIERVFADGLDVVRYEYDSLGRRIREIRDPSYVDELTGEQLYQGLDITTEYAYDDNNNLISRTAANGAQTFYFYDNEDRQIYSVNELGEVTRNEYDATGNIIVATEYADTISTFRLLGGRDVSAIQARLQAGVMDRVVEFAYDNDNRLIYTRDALGYLAATEYEAGTNRVASTHQYAAPYETSFVQRDVDGNIVDNVLSEQITAVSSSEDRTQTTVYDELGRAEFQLDASGALMQNVFDGAGRLVATRAFAVIPIGTDYDALTTFASDNASATNTQMTWYLYDAANRQTHRVDAEGYVTESRYDRAGRLTVLREYKNSLFDQLTEDQRESLQANPVVDLGIRVTDFTDNQSALQQTHIEQARQVAAGDQSAVIQQPVFRETRTGYDHAGRVISITDAMGELQRSYFGEVQGVHTEYYTYDQMGNRTSLTNKAGETWYYQYDALGRLVEERTPQVRQTRVQGVVSSADFNVAHDITGVDVDGVDRKLKTALEGFEFSGDISYGEIIQDEEELSDIDNQELQHADAELNIQNLDASAISMQGDASILQNAVSRNSNSSWQVDFNADIGVSAQIGLDGSLVSYDDNEVTDGFGLILVLDEGTFKVESREGEYVPGSPNVRTQALVHIDQQDLENPAPLYIDPDQQYRAVFTVSKHTQTVYEEADVTTTQTVLDEDGNESDETYIETVIVPRKEVTASLHVQLLTNDGGDWTVVSVADFEVDPEIPTSGQWVHKDGETDAPAQLSIKTTDNNNGAVLELSQIQQVLPDAAQGEWSEGNVSFTTVDSVRTRYAYDSLGNVSLMVEAYGAPEQRETRFTYDQLGRQRSTVHPDVSVYLEGLDALFGADDITDLSSDLGYSSNTRFERMETPREHTYYDSFGNEVGHTDVRNNNSFKIYDRGNRLSFEVDAAGYVTEYGYDAFGNVSTVTRYEYSVYDEINAPDLAALWEAIDPGQEQSIVNFRFGVSLDDFSGVVDWLKGVDAESNPNSGYRLIETQFDALNRKVAVVQTVDNVITRDYVDTVETLQVDNNISLKTGYEYDAFGRVIREWQAAYDDQGAEIEAPVSAYHFYNELGQLLATVDQERYITTFEYDGEGNLIGQREYANHLNETDAQLLSYARSGQFAELDLNAIERVVSEATLWDEWQGGYDRVLRYEYDALDRQVSVWQDNLAQDILTANPDDVEDHKSEVSAERQYSNSVLQSQMEYDALGNVVKTVDAGGAATHTYYDVLGRVTAVIEPERLSQTQDTPEQLSIRHTGKGTGSAQLEWKTPQLAGVENIELRLVGLNDSQSSVVLLSKSLGSIVESADGYTHADIGELASDRYQYEVIYTRVGDSTVYGVAKGEVDVITDQAPADSSLLMHWVDVERVNGYDVPTLNLRGTLPGSLQVYVDDQLIAGNIAAGTGALQLSETYYGTHTYTLVENDVVIGMGTYQIHTGSIHSTRFSVGEATYEVDGKITKRQSFKWSSSKPSWKGSNRLRYNLSGFEHLGLDNLRYNFEMTRSDAVGGTGEKRISGNNGSDVNQISYSERIKSRKKYRDVRLQSLNDLTLTASYRGEQISLINGKGEDFRTDYLEFYNLYEDAENQTSYSGEIVLRYRIYQPAEQAIDADDGMPAQRAVEWRELRLAERASGYYAVGKDALPDGIVEYQLIEADPGDFELNGKLKAGAGQNITTAVLGSQSHQLLETDPTIASAILNLGGVDAQVDIDSAGYTFIAPLTEFQYDSLGNRVAETRFAEGAVVGRYDVDGYTVRDSEFDQGRIWRYDVNGNMRQYQNAEGSSTYYSYDEAGNLRKEWSAVEYLDVNGAAGSKVQGKVYRYDENGQQVEVITLRPFMADLFDGGDAGELSVQQMDYNAFGEMIGQRTLSESDWLNASTPGYDEYFDYDDSGRLIRTNQKTGVDTVYLYDSKGRVLFEVRHNGAEWDHYAGDHQSGYFDLRTESLDSILSEIDSVASSVAATRYDYDNLGRVIQMRQPLFSGVDGSNVSRLITPIVNQTLDRWGNALTSETSAEYRDSINDDTPNLSGVLSKVEYYYNHRNQQVYSVQTPQGAQGVDYWAQVDDDPTLFREESLTEITNQTFYDNTGREIASIDANGNLRARYYDAAGNEVRVVNGEGYHEYQQFDALGNLREKTNALGNSQYYVYDKENRLVRHYTPSGGETRYEYDSAGNRNHIQQLLSRENGVDEYLQTWQVYDALGNVVRTKVGDENSVAGLYTYYAYDEYGNKSFEAKGNRTSGPTNTDAVTGGVSAIWLYDAFGRMKEQIDFGGYRSNYSYDDAGMLRDKHTETRTISAGAGQALDEHTIQYDYLTNGLLTHQQVVGVNGDVLSGSGDQTTDRLPIADYSYDALGRQITEEIRFSESGGVVSTINTYDTFGRLSSVSASSTIGGVWSNYQMDLQFGYDAMGNRRFVNGATGDDSNESWYGYDGENRISHAQFNVTHFSQDNDEYYAQLDTTTSEGAYQIDYDKFGNRSEMTRFEGVNRYYESYEYNADNRHTGTRLTYFDGNVEETLYSSVLVNKKEYDLAGRLLMQSSAQHQESDTYTNSNVDASRAYTHYFYNELNQQIRTVTLSGNLAETVSRSEAYSKISAGSGATDASNIVKNVYNADGTLRRYFNTFYNGEDSQTFRYTYGYAWFDDAKTARIVGVGGSDYKVGTTDEYYDVTGNLVRLNDRYKNANDRDFYSNAQGQILYADWDAGENQTRDEFHYYSSGRAVGESSVATETTYNWVKVDADETGRSGRGVASLFNFKKVPDVTRDAASSMDPNFQSIGQHYPAPSGGTYTVQSSGEHLESIAMALWGDSSLWYMLADENGLTKGESLSAGQALRIPNVLTNVHNNVNTFKPYNAGEIIGNTLPDIPLAPPPSEDAGCGAAQIIVVAVVIIVSVYTAGAAAGAFGVGGGGFAGGVAVTSGATLATNAAVTIGAAFAGGFAGNLAGQVAGNVLGIRQGYSFSEAAIGGLSAAATAGIGGGALDGLKVGEVAWAKAATWGLQQTANYAVNYGISKVAGYDVSFSWRDVAANMVAAQVTNSIGPVNTSSDGGRIVQETLLGAAEGVIRREITRSFSDGGKMSTEEILGNSFGQAIGNSIVGRHELRYSTLEKTGDFGLLNDWFGGGNRSNSVMGPNDGPQIPQHILAARQMQQEGWDFGPNAKLPSSVTGGVVNSTGSNRTVTPVQDYIWNLDQYGNPKQYDPMPEMTAFLNDMSAQADSFARSAYISSALNDPIGYDYSDYSNIDISSVRMEYAEPGNHFSRMASAAWSVVREPLLSFGSDFVENPVSALGGLWLDSIETTGRFIGHSVGAIGYAFGNPHPKVEAYWAGLWDGVTGFGDVLYEAGFNNNPDAQGSILPAMAMMAVSRKVPNKNVLRQTGGSSGYIDPADELYDAIRASDTDVSAIAANTGIKPQNIQKVKDHVFYNEHVLDRYVHLGEPAEIGRFHSNMNQADAWKRFEAGTHTDADMTWLKHETAERWYELKYNSGYTEAHDRVDYRWSGNPWGADQ